MSILKGAFLMNKREKNEFRECTLRGERYEMGDYRVYSVFVSIGSCDFVDRGRDVD